MNFFSRKKILSVKKIQRKEWINLFQYSSVVVGSYWYFETHLNTCTNTHKSTTWIKWFYLLVTTSVFLSLYVYCNWFCFSFIYLFKWESGIQEREKKKSNIAIRTSSSTTTKVKIAGLISRFFFVLFLSKRNETKFKPINLSSSSSKSESANKQTENNDTISNLNIHAHTHKCNKHTYYFSHFSFAGHPISLFIHLFILIWFDMIQW